MYLLHHNWIEGIKGGIAWITVDGIEYLEQKDDEQLVEPLIQQNMFILGNQNNIAQAGEKAEVNYIINDSSQQLIEAARQLIDELKKDSSVDQKDRIEAIDLIDTVKEQVETDGKPKQGIVVSTLDKLNKIGSYVSNSTALYKFIMDFLEILKRFSL